MREKTKTKRGGRKKGPYYLSRKPGKTVSGRVAEKESATRKDKG